MNQDGKKCKHKHNKQIITEQEIPRITTINYHSSPRSSDGTVRAMQEVCTSEWRTVYVQGTNMCWQYV